MISSKAHHHQLNQEAERSGSSALSFADFKKSLGKAAQKYSDDQIEAIRIAFDKIADVAFDAWLIRKNTT